MVNKINDLKAIYFSHDCNARNDEKLIRLRMKHGAAGYGIYFMLLERFGSCNNYVGDLDYDLISYELREDVELIKDVIENYGLFEISNDEFYSRSFQVRMSLKDKSSINGIKGNLIRYGHATKKDLEGMTDEEIISFNSKIKNPTYSGANSGANSGAVRNKEINKEINNEINKEEERALDFLYKNYPSRFETQFLMRYKSNILNYKKFVEDFNDTVEQENLDYSGKILFARLGKYARNWIENQSKYNKPNLNQEPISNAPKRF